MFSGKIPERFAWAFTPYGYSFLSAHPYKQEATEATPTSTGAVEDSLFSKTLIRCDPLSTVIKDYREHLLERALQCICGAGQGKNYMPSVKRSKQDETSSGNMISTSQISDVLYYTQLLNGTEFNFLCYFLALNVCSNILGCQDELSIWWSNLLTIAAHWLLGEDDTADSLYATVEVMPRFLIENSDTLPKALLATLKAKKALM